MTKEQMMTIGLALNHIAMAVDDATFAEIKSSFDEIEETVLVASKKGESV